MAASGRPRVYSGLDSRRKRAYPSLSPLEMEGEGGYRSPSPERKARNWRGGRGASWRLQDMDDREAARNSPSQEEDDYDDGTWGGPGRGSREASWEPVSPKWEGSLGSWEPPQKRARSPPLDEWWGDPPRPSRGKGWASPESHSGHASRRNRSSSSSSRRDTTTGGGGGGSPRSWEDLGLDTGKNYPLEDRSYPTKDRGGGRGGRTRRRGRRTQNVLRGKRVMDPTGPSRGHRGRQEWKEDPEESGSFSSQSQFSLKGRSGRPIRREDDDGWAGDEGFEKLRSAAEDVDDWDNFTEPLEWDPKEGQGSVEGSAEGEFGGPKYQPKAYDGSRKSAIFPVGWVPRKEVLDFWRRCQSVMRKSVREYLLSTCPRPAMPDRSTETPELNTSIMALLSEKQARSVSLATRNLYMAQDELLNMLAPAMTIYEMAEEAIEKGEALDPLELREWVRRVIRYIGSINQRLTQLRRAQVLGAINPRLKTMTRLVNSKSGGMLFAHNQVKFLKEMIRNFPEVAKEPQREGRSYHPGTGAKNATDHVR